METEKKNKETIDLTAWGFVAVPLIFTFIYLAIISSVAENGASAISTGVLSKFPIYFNGIVYGLLGFFDRKQLQKEGIENPPNLGFAILLPFVYLFKRCTLVKDEKRTVFWAYLGSLGASMLFLVAG